MNNQSNKPNNETKMMLTPEHRRSARRRVNAPKKNPNTNQYNVLSNYKPKKLYYDDEGKWEGDDRTGVYSIYYTKNDSDDEN